MAFARSVAAQIEGEIAAITSRRERALFHDYMEACSSVRPGPVLALNRDVVMMNEQLSTAVTGPDHYALLDHAREIADSPGRRGRAASPCPPDGSPNSGSVAVGARTATRAPSSESG
ncbi:hypothetical protein [Streptomyces sp. F001]|uniref:hypothetical protein n=1 Tax=Streptomyces sp. F001 TaxID=1510026 RepID=UPI001F10460F|nr:hypothetical protein [Streptomyces sp. F001]